MGFFKDLGEELENAIDRGAKMIDEAGFNSKINDKRREIDKVEEELGELFYKAYKDGEDLSGIGAYLFKKIDDLYTDIEKIEAEKEAAKKS